MKRRFINKWGVWTSNRHYIKPMHRASLDDKQRTTAKFKISTKQNQKLARGRHHVKTRNWHVAGTSRERCRYVVLTAISVSSAAKLMPETMSSINACPCKVTTNRNRNENQRHRTFWRGSPMASIPIGRGVCSSIHVYAWYECTYEYRTY